MSDSQQAPGRPGVAPRWTTSRKDGIGTARGGQSHVWFAIYRGILGEIYFPRLDTASVKDMGMLVSDGKTFFSEEKTDTDSQVSWIRDGVPGFHLTNTCKRGRYVIEKTIVADSVRHVVLQKTKFTVKKGSLRNYHLYVLLAPHLANHGMGDTATVQEFKGMPILAAEGRELGLALASSAPWLARSAGFVGISDGWQDVSIHKKMTWQYAHADDGNVALIGEIDLSAGGEFVLSLGFGRAATEAAHRARASLNQGFDSVQKDFERQWTDWHKSLRLLRSGSKANTSAYRASTTVLAAHESKDFPGGTIASLSFPWGEIHGDEDQGGYHLLWPRDAYETTGALLAAGTKDEVVRALNFYETTQEPDGSWPQNMWLDGRKFWNGIQLDEIAAPILLLDLSRRYGKLDAPTLQRFWPMVRKAAAYIVQTGPSSPQDRWEEDAGLTAFTLASTIAALLIAADMADENNRAKLATFLRQTADSWNDSIERWTYITHTPLARKVGVDGYYVRIAPPERLSERTPLTQENVTIANVDGQKRFTADEIVSVDALALVRFGLREAKDPKILNTLRVIDAVLKVETPRGPCWHRYNHDGYGEKADGSPFEHTGIGRLWPLFAGERAHYELAAGNDKEARRYGKVMEALASDTGLFSEQVWDEKPIPEKELFPGRPTGSARPLVWAHAEHIKLLRSLADGVVFDTPRQTVQRYLKNKTHSPFRVWGFEGQIAELPRGKTLRIETKAAARVHYSTDGWKTVKDAEMRDTGIGIFVADLPTKSLAMGTKIIFTFYWPKDARWEGRDFIIVVGNEMS